MHNIDVPDGFFFPRITDEQAERALWLDTLSLSVAEKFMLSLVPVSTKVPSGWWKSQINVVHRRATVYY